MDSYPGNYFEGGDGKYYGEMFHPNAGLPAIDTEDTEDSRPDKDRLREFLTQILKRLDIVDVDKTKEEVRDFDLGKSIVSWLKSSVGLIRVVGYIGVTALTLVVYNPESEWALAVPLVLYTIHRSLSQRGRTLGDLGLVGSLVFLVNKFSYAYLPSDTEAVDACLNFSSRSACATTMEDLKKTLGHVTLDLLSLTYKLKDLGDEEPHTSEAIVLSKLPGLMELSDASVKLAGASTLISFMFALYKTGSIGRGLARVNRKVGWLQSLLVPYTIHELVKSFQATNLTTLFRGMSTILTSLVPLLKSFVSFAIGHTSQAAVVRSATLAVRQSGLTPETVVEGESLVHVVLLVGFVLLFISMVLKQLLR
jgi:hypothetical protein